MNLEIALCLQSLCVSKQGQHENDTAYPDPSEDLESRSPIRVPRKVRDRSIRYHITEFFRIGGPGRLGFSKRFLVRMQSSPPLPAWLLCQSVFGYGLASFEEHFGLTTASPSVPCFTPCQSSHSLSVHPFSSCREASQGSG